MLRKPVGRDGGDEARIRNDSQEARMQRNTSKRAHKKACSSARAAPKVTYWSRQRPLANSLEFNFSQMIFRDIKSGLVLMRN